ncbi:hypothetical protein OEZ85_002548 [Tetradesmus obliquus]|uniref:Peptidase M60 domain-containing protein n=1 Tax=Tetradesmus obliquus TaxID=3088 RepID=A0ABY8TYE1_TETOB|nr:hypothetical protein OEZ85_002548 [Tetradesmus obliquus]
MNSKTLFKLPIEKSTGRCFIAATRSGKGRLVQLGHESTLSSLDTMGPLLKNAAAWASSNANKVAVGWNASAETLVDYLISQTAFVSDRYTDAGEVKFNRLSVDQVQLLFLIGQDKAIGQYAASIRNFIRAGGGVIIAAQAWYWSYTNPIARHPNILTAPLGLVLTGDAFESGFTFAISAPPSQTSNAVVAVKCLEDSCLGKKASACYTEDQGQLASMMRSMTRAAEFAPATSAFMTRLATLARTYAKGGLDPTKPVAIRSPDALGVAARTAWYKGLPPNQLPAAPDAKFFPGLPPAGTEALDAARVKIKGTTADSYWQGLGLWAMAVTQFEARLFWLQASL